MLVQVSKSKALHDAIVVGKSLRRSHRPKHFAASYNGNRFGAQARAVFQAWEGSRGGWLS